MCKSHTYKEHKYNKILYHQCTDTYINIRVNVENILFIIN